MSRTADDQRRYYLRHPEQILFGNAQQRAKRKGIEFSITREDIAIPDYCPLLGIKLSKGSEGGSDHSPSLDRIDPSFGYTKDNIWVISMKANRLKNDATLAEMEMLVCNWKRKVKL